MSNKESDKDYSQILGRSGNRKSDLPMIIYSIRRGGNIEVRDKNNNTPLHNACINREPEIIETLLNADADIEAKNNDEDTPLDCACWTMCVRSIRILVNSKRKKSGEELLTQELMSDHELLEFEMCNLLARKTEERSVADYVNNERREEKETLLHIACEAGKANIVRMLIRNDADIEARKENDITPLHITSSSEIIEILIEEGANTCAKDSFGNTPLYYASEYGSLDMVMSLTSRLKESTSCSRLRRLIGLIVPNTITKRCNNDKTALHVACEEDHHDIIKVLVKKGADASAKDREGLTPLHYLQYFVDDESVIDSLISGGAKIDSKDNNLRTPLCLAVMEGRFGLVKTLVAKGANKNVVDRDLNTLLHLLGKRGSPKIAEFLVEEGISIGAKNKRGDTPLHVSSNNSNFAVVELLLITYKADTKSRNKNGDTPLISASSNELGGSIVGFLLDNGASHCETNNYGVTPLHKSCLCGSLYTTSILLDKGAYVNAVSKRNLTPLHYAAHSGSLHIIKHLVNNSADVNIESVCGNTALHLLCSKGLIYEAEILVEKGANIYTKNKDGLSPIDILRLRYPKKVGRLLSAVRVRELRKQNIRKANPTTQKTHT